MVTAPNLGHRCAAMPTEGVEVYLSDEFLGDTVWQWCLVVAQAATESDLEENPYLEEVGEPLWQTVVGISHCPYCGERLDSRPDKVKDWDAEFYHLDFARWHSKVQ